MPVSVSHHQSGREITGASQVYALIGDPVSHSLSPQFWNRAFAACGLDAVYVALPVARDGLPVAIRGLQASGVRGINLTSPHKQTGAELCDRLHDPADEIGAVNCIKFTDRGGIEGWNTDATGMMRALAQFEKEEIALVMGNGGAAAAACLALKRRGVALIYQIARSFSGSVGSGERSGVKKLQWNKKNFRQAVDKSAILINATPLGRHENDFIDEFEDLLSKSKLYVDFNYAPKSGLIKTARLAGCTVVDGRELLLRQGLEAFELLTGHQAPEQVISDCIFGR